MRYLEDDFSDPDFPMLDELFTLPDLVKGLGQLKNGTAPGHDKIMNELLIVSEDIRPALLCLFNKVLDSGVYPKCWKGGITVPVHKSGSTQNLRNYRGITLMPVISKLYTRLLNNRLHKWATENGKYHPGQAGFRGGYSSSGNVFILMQMAQCYGRKRKKLYVCFLDAAKAFD